LKEFCNTRPPENYKELFNLRHSSLRTTIERVFGILKAKWAILTKPPRFPYPTQVNIVIACCILHNIIIRLRGDDDIFHELEDEGGDNNEVDEPTETIGPQTRTARELRKECLEWTNLRDRMAQEMWVEYSSHT
jgi:hypothetical protein